MLFSLSYNYLGLIIQKANARMKKANQRESVMTACHLEDMNVVTKFPLDFYINIQ